jgi:hypothetical protein
LAAEAAGFLLAAEAAGFLLAAEAAGFLLAAEAVIVLQPIPKFAPDTYRVPLQKQSIVYSM